MNSIAGALWNPIVAKEYRSRMRTWRSPLTITIHVLVLGGIGWAVFSAIASSVGSYGIIGPGFAPSAMGLILFEFLIIFQLGLLAFITPALTSGAISGERERQTIDLLFVTPLAPFSIIWGKLLASMSFIVLLLFLSIPIFSLVFLFGGIELDQVVASFALTAVSALTLGLVGVAFSTLFKRTLAATVASYGAAFVLLVGSPAFGLLFPTEYDPSTTTVPAPPALALVSPVVPLLVIATNQPLSTYGTRPTQPTQGQFGKGTAVSAGGYCGPTANGTVFCSSASVLGPAGSRLSPGTTLPSGFLAGWQYWQASAVMQLMICAVALGLSALLLPPIRRLRFWRGIPVPEEA
jgi:ABC-type transport system involved in multi-copper enzyme maturation permease subunit